MWCARASCGHPCSVESEIENETNREPSISVTNRYPTSGVVQNIPPRRFPHENTVVCYSVL